MSRPTICPGKGLNIQKKGDVKTAYGCNRYLDVEDLGKLVKDYASSLNVCKGDSDGKRTQKAV